MFLFQLFFNFGRKHSKNLWLIDGHFLTIFGNFFASYIKIVHKTEVQTIILRCLVCWDHNWIKSLGIILAKILFFHCWKCIISGVKNQSEFWYLIRKLALIFSKWLFFQKILGVSWATYLVKKQVKEMKFIFWTFH